MGAEKRRLIHQWRALKDKEREEMVKREAELEAQMNPLLRPKTASVVANLTNKEKENLRKKQVCMYEWMDGWMETSLLLGLMASLSVLIIIIITS